MLSLMIGVFDPVDKLGVEGFERVNPGEVAHEELVAHGAKEALNLAFGRSITYRGVDELDAEPPTDEGKFLRTVI